MTIRHTDRTGHVWTYKIDCTPIQGRMFKRLLSSVSCVGSREQIALSYLENEDGNGAFRDGIENAVLSALKTWAENRTTDKPKPLPTPVTLPQPNRERLDVIRRRVGGTVNTHSPTVATDATDDDTDDGRVRYYWEDF